MGFSRASPYIVYSDPFPVLLSRTILKRPVQQCKPGVSQDENRFGLVCFSNVRLESNLDLGRPKLPPETHQNNALGITKLSDTFLFLLLLRMIERPLVCHYKPISHDLANDFFLSDGAAIENNWFLIHEIGLLAATAVKRVV